MPETPVHLRLPERCPVCGVIGHVALETSISGGIVKLTWWCRRCEHAWDVKRKDETDSGIFPKPKP